MGFLKFVFHGKSCEVLFSWLIHLFGKADHWITRYRIMKSVVFICVLREGEWVGGWGVIGCRGRRRENFDIELHVSTLRS